MKTWLKNTALVMGMSLSGAALAQAPTPDAKTTTEQFGDWALQCSERGENKACRASQQLRTQEGQVIAVANLLKDNEGKLVLEFGLPLMVDLRAQVGIQIDDQEAVRVPYSLCNAQACFVLTQEAALLDGFKAGNQAKVMFKPVSMAQAVEAPFSLKGFSGVQKALLAQ